MSHAHQMRFFELVFNAVLRRSGTRIIDFGSLDINGGPHRLLNLIECEYIGVDLDNGANVNLVLSGELVDYPTKSFDIAMSSELFEHAVTWREIFYNMCRLTKPGGIVVLSCAGRFRPEHGTSKSDNGFSAPFVVSSGSEYYKNVSAKDIKNAISLDIWFDLYGLYENHGYPQDTYFVGIRKGSTEPASENLKLLIDSLDIFYSQSYFVSKFLILKSFIISRVPILGKIRDLFP